MLNKKTIIIGSVVLLTGLTGVSFAATHSDPQIPTNKVQLLTMKEIPDTDGSTIKVESTEPEVAPATVSVTPVAPVDETSPTAEESFHQAVIDKAAIIYPYANTGQSLADFTWMQYYCIYDRGTDKQSVTQAQFDEKLTFFNMTRVDGEGVPHYQYFTGGCRVYET